MDCNADSICNKVWSTLPCHLHKVEHNIQTDGGEVILKMEKRSEARVEPQGTPCCYREIDQICLNV